MSVAEAAIPYTPAAQVFRQGLTSLNGGVPDTVLAFENAHRPEKPST